MKSFSSILVVRALLTAVCFQQLPLISAAPHISLSLDANTAIVVGGKAEIYIPSSKTLSARKRSAKTPLLIGNDGTAQTGGFRAWELQAPSPSSELPQKLAEIIGRTKLVGVVYDVAEKDLIVTLSQSDSILRVFEAGEGGKELVGSRKKIWGDFSALCSWTSPVSGEVYFYIFGKKSGSLFAVRELKKKGVEVVEIQTFKVPIEAQTCAVSQQTGTVFFGGETGTVYTFPALESTSQPTFTTLSTLSSELKGFSIYTNNRTTEYLFVALPKELQIYTLSLDLVGTASFPDVKGLRLKDIALFQSSSNTSDKKFPDGAIAYAMKTKTGTGFGVSSLTKIFANTELKRNPNFDPRSNGCKILKNCTSAISPSCSNNGYLNSKTGSCECFSGTSGKSCAEVTCKNSCSSQGSCKGPNVCECAATWGGPDCSSHMVSAKYETDPNGADGDDPAIWISPENVAESRIITTTKSDDGTGLGVFDLKGKKLMTLDAGKPNNVDVIYQFDLGSRKVDLAYAACRVDNTLCIFEITSKGELKDIAGGSQPTKPDYVVYGSCTYRSPKSGKQYLFVNSKTSEYLQFELTAGPNGTLTTTLARSFQGGSGGQVEGCVVDDENGRLFVGEEPYGLWQYGAEPTDSTEGYLIDKVETEGGHLIADVEGVTMVSGKTKDTGFILVSCQGISAYNVYQRAYPHKYVKTFSVEQNADGSIDRVTNTDGLTAVSTRLNSDFEGGLVVVHDDANELPNGSVSPYASFKLLDLTEVLGKDLAGELGTDWDPRAGL